MELRPRHLNRYRQIAQVMGKHGFGFLLSELGLRPRLPFRGRVWQGNEQGGPSHLRHALQELGATFIKLGQLLSTRADLLPPEYIDELTLLQDSLPPVPLETMAQVIEQELGSPPEVIFTTFEPQPLAAASTSQVHAATLADGRRVVVKVQRPGVAELFAVDLDIIRNVAAVASQRTRWGRDYDLVGLAEEMATTLRPSLNYRAEGRNADRFRAVFADDPTVHVPLVYWDYSTTRVLTMERVEGVKVTDHAGLDAFQIDRRALALQSTRVLMKMVFEVGLFHADPHPGNFFVRRDGSLGVMDFGLVGHIGEATREDLSRLLFAIVNRDPDRMVTALAELGVLRRQQQRANLTRDLERLLFEYYDLPLGEISLGHLISDAMRIANRRGLLLPTNMALLATVIAANEGMGRTLDPNFRLLQEARPYARQLFSQYYSPWQLAQRFGQGLIDAVDLTPQMPARLHGILRQVERGNMEVGVRSDQMDRLAHQISASANRLALSAIVAAFIVSLAILLAFYRLPFLNEMAALFLALGFVVASGLGLWLLIWILRSD